MDPFGTDTNWLFSPVAGFSYSLVASELKGDPLALNFAPVELWTDTCATADPATAPSDFCDCTTTPCSAADKPTRKLDLVVSGDTMAGEITRPPGNWLGSVPEIKLERVQ